MKLSKPIILLLCCFLFACDKDFDTINENPLQPSQVADGAIFNELVNSLRLGWNRQLFLHNEILYDVTEQAVVTAQTFGNVEGGVEDVWSNYYTALKNANALYQNLNLEIHDQQRAMVDILMAYKTFQVTDLFGDIPYSEAGQAFLDNPIIRPQYDSQESIYKKLIEDLREASISLTSGDKTSDGENYLRFGTFETLFRDNKDKWIRFANSLQLRYLIRMYERDPEFVEPRVAELISTGANTLIANGDALMSPREQMWTNLGVNWSFAEHNKVRMGSTMWAFLTEDNEQLDPRLGIFFETNNNDEWVPFPQISDNSTPQSGGEPYRREQRDGNHAEKGAGNIYSPVNYYLIRDDLDIPEILMTSAEVQFLRAEIFLRGIGVSQDPFLAQSAYRQGMLESMDFWEGLMENSEIWINKSRIFSSSEKFLLTEHPKYKLDPSADINSNLEKIYAQRWVDTFRQPWEGFSLLRRTNKVPREKPENTFNRFKYPPSEVALNSSSYQEQISKMGGDERNVKVWWQAN